MNLSDEDDLFASDEEFMPKIVKENPIQDKFFTELHNVEERIDQATTNIQQFESSIETISKQFAYRVKYGEELENNFQGEWVTYSCEPIIESQNEIVKCYQPLTIRYFHQYIVDDKWIVLVALRNATNWCLKDLRFYVALKGDKELHGTSTFWSLAHDSIWNTTNLIEANSNLVVATATFDVPSFVGGTAVDASGVILYEAAKKNYQTIVPNFSLSVNNSIDDKLSPQFENQPENSILALKAISIDKTVSFNIQFSDACERFINFLRRHTFTEIFEDIQIIKNGSLKYCILEMLSITPDEITVRIVVRHSFQLSIVLSLLRAEFPDVPNFETKENLKDAADVLLQEMRLYLANAPQAQIQRAKINTDCYIP